MKQDGQVGCARREDWSSPPRGWRERHPGKTHMCRSSSRNVNRQAAQRGGLGYLATNYTVTYRQGLIRSLNGANFERKHRNFLWRATRSRSSAFGAPP